MLNDRQIDFRGEPQRLAHDAVVEDGFAVITDAHGASALQRAKIGEHRPFARMSRCGDREDIYNRTALRLLQPGDPLRRVNHGLSVGHATNGSESSGSSCGSAGRDSLLITLPGLAQVDMQVDEAG